MRGATIRDVARAADVSVATVSRVFNGLGNVTDATRDRVRAVAATLGYVPHSGARSLSMRRTDTVGVILPDLHGEFFSELIRGIDAATRARRLHLLLSHSHGDPAEAAAVLRAMRGRVDALVVMSPYADEEVLAAAPGATPLVLLGGVGHSDRHPRFSIDNRGGALAMTAHLIAAGHRDIAFVAGPADNLDAAQRLEGYRAALAAHGGLAERVVAGDFGEGAGLAAARAMIAEGLPDAVFAGNDMMAIGCLQGFREAGVAVPGDVALAGFDDIPVARFLDPPLATVGVPIAEIGRHAVECCARILETGEEGESRTFSPMLIVRASAGRNESRSDDRPNRGDARHEDIVIT
jgi:LacI family transcriptional regulator